MSVKYLTDNELEDLIIRFDTDDPRDSAVFYALIELKSYRWTHPLVNEKPLGECEDSTKGANKTSIE